MQEEREYLKLAKNGRLVENKWDSTSQKYVKQDVTDKATTYFFREVEFDEALTLRDVLLFVKEHKNLWSSIVNFNIDKMLEEAFDTPPKIQKYPKIEYLELYWILEIEREYELFKDGPKEPPLGSLQEQMGLKIEGEFSGRKKLIGYRFPDFHAVSQILTKDWDYYKKGERVNFSAASMSLSDILHLPVRLNQDICICDSLINVDWNKDNTTVYDMSEYSLGQAIYGILYEISWGESLNSDLELE